MTARAPEPHPEAQAFLEMYEALNVPPFEELEPREARQMMEEMRAGVDVGIEMKSVEDRTVDGPRGDVPVRLYEPDAETEDTEQRPLVLYFHGGGWVIGSVETHDATCRKLAAESGYPVASVDYALAPENPFPEGLEDCYAALEWASEAASELDADGVVVAGDSAGGNLAAATTLLARDRGGPEIAYQVLVYPPTGKVEETDAYEENAEGYFLSRDDMNWFRDQYFENEMDRGNVYARPRLADDLSDLPPATVVTAGFDPLRDDGAAYAERLEDAGADVTHHHYEDMIHGFFSMLAEPANLGRGHEAHEDVAADLRAFFADR